MNFNAKDDFVNDYQAELQAELDAENRLEAEQDHGFDTIDNKPTSGVEEQVDSEEEDESPKLLSDPMINYDPQDELDRVTNRESYEQFKNFNKEE